MHTVIRLQQPNGRGPYNDRMYFNDIHNDWTSQLHARTRDRVKYPNPTQEGLDFDKQHRCAFRSVEEAVEWFTPTGVVDKLRELKFGLYEVVVEGDLLEGQKQVMFDVRTVRDMRFIGYLPEGE